MPIEAPTKWITDTVKAEAPNWSRYAEVTGGLKYPGEAPAQGNNEPWARVEFIPNETNTMGMGTNSKAELAGTMMASFFGPKLGGGAATIQILADSWAAHWRNKNTTTGGQTLKTFESDVRHITENRDAAGRSLANRYQQFNVNTKYRMINI